MKKFTIFFFILFLSLILIFPRKVNAIVYFYDYFDNPDYQKWDFIGNGGWSIVEGKLGIRLNPGLSNALPKDIYWDSSWTNYVYKVDLLGVAGTDKNIVINFNDNGNYYEMHAHEDHIHFDKYVGGIYYPLTVLSGQNSYPFTLINGTTYHFKFIKNGHNIKVFLNNTQIFDLSDNAPYLEGKIGLRVGTGAVSPTEVWYDNVMVCSLDDPCEPSGPAQPTPTPLPPVVFLPGLGGSINFKAMFLGDTNSNEWQLTPGANVYQNILKAFNYPDNPNFYVFYYDWRKSVLDNAQKLDNFIKNTVKPWNNKVDLIGHSLGGLVARACVQKNDDHCMADKLITVGSPNLGAIDAYPAVEAGEIWRTGVMKMALELFLHYYQKPGETRRETLIRIAPVMYDLLPNFDYLYKNGSPFPWENLSVENPLLSQLSDFSKLENITKTLYGNSYPTLNSLTLTEANTLDKVLGNWPDGVPDTKNFTTEGDGIVLSLSAKIDHPNIENFSFDLDHGGIISSQSALEKIFSLVNRELLTTNNNPLKETENYLVFFVHSPVKISSPDTQISDFISDELIIIPNPQNKIYTLNVEGLQNGYYSLSVGQILGEKVVWNDYFGESRTNKSQAFRFTINPESAGENPLVDPSGINTKAGIQARIGEFRKEVSESNLKKAFLKVLLDILGKIEKDKNFPEKGLLDISLLRKTLLAFKQQKILTEDLSLEFRKKANELNSFFEFLAFLNPRKVNKYQAQVVIKSTNGIKEEIFKDKLNKAKAFIFLEAQEKFEKAKNALGKGEYYRALIYAQEAKDLFLEVRTSRI